MAEGAPTTRHANANEHASATAGEATGAILARCEELGFAAAGVCRAEATAYERELRAWLAAGKHGEMGYLEEHADLRVDPKAMVPGARSIVCVADRYAGPGGEVAGEAFARTGEGRPAGRIARYARGRDYHREMKKRLQTLADELRERFPDETFRVCVDTAPVLEREHARRAGIGAVGKHTLLIQRGTGSYLLLGEILTTLELEPTSPAREDPCSTCTRCVDACPTGAITPFSVDATKCISYLTIEHRGLIDAELHEGMGDWIFGCDVCQEVCPHNRPTRKSRGVPIHEAYEARRESFDLLEVLGWTEADRRAAFVASSMKRAKLPMMRRNALIAAGNHLRRHPDEALERRVREIAADDAEDATVRETARVVQRNVARGGIDAET